MTRSSEHKLYRNTRDAKVMGVCAGLADYLDVKVCLVRFLTILGIVFSGGWLIAVYVVLGLVLDPKPDYLYDEDEREYERRKSDYRREKRAEKMRRKEERYYHKKRRWQREFSDRPDYDTRDVRRRFDEVEKRMRKLEAYLTSKKFRLDREIRGLED